jgi:hypothetical protein
MANTNCLEGMACPKIECRSEGPFHIMMSVVATVSDDGWSTDDIVGGSTEWYDESYCCCAECGHTSNVGEFLQYGGYLSDEREEGKK